MEASNESWGSIPCPVLFNIFMNGLGDGAECNLSKAADGTKLRGVANTPGGCAALQRDLDWLEEWDDRNVTEFTKKCKVLPLGRNKSRHQDMLGAPKVECCLTETDLGGLVDIKMLKGLYHL